jgi:beta-N-acetylhexosaminidase
VPSRRHTAQDNSVNRPDGASRGPGLGGGSRRRLGRLGPRLTAHRRRLAALAAAITVAAAVVAPAGGPAAGADRASETFAAMTDAQRVGQLFMAALNSADSISARDSLIVNYHVGSVILQGRWTGAASVRSATSHLKSLVGPSSTANAGLYLAGDQEGGQIQPFRGSGFSTMPSALSQGQESAAWLRSHAAEWGSQLASAGLNLDLAPVADTVPSAAAAANNPPIGQLQREFGYTPSGNATHVTAFIQGMHDAGVATSAKHFPGLGRVDANTDFAADVVDSVTTADDPYLQPFKAGIAAGSEMVMVGTAIYSKIDSGQQAAFSSTIVTGLLRQKLGFSGVVISDSLNAAAVNNISPANRALRFVRAGGDIMLLTDNSLIPTMQQAILSEMNASSSFRSTVYAAVRRVLQAKQTDGLLGAAPPTHSPTPPPTKQPTAPPTTKPPTAAPTTKPTATPPSSIAPTTTAPSTSAPSTTSAPNALPSLRAALGALTSLIGIPYP